MTFDFFTDSATVPVLGKSIRQLSLILFREDSIYARIKKNKNKGHATHSGVVFFSPPASVTLCLGDGVR